MAITNFYLIFKENNENENDMTFCYFSCLGRYCFEFLAHVYGSFTYAAVRLLFDPYL
jgi:hypothetical protein